MRHVAVLNNGETVTRAMLPAELLGDSEQSDPLPRTEAAPAMALDTLVGKPLAEVEKLVIEATIATHGGSIPKAARVLDVSPSTLYRKIEGWKAHGRS